MLNQILTESVLNFADATAAKTIQNVPVTAPSSSWKGLLGIFVENTSQTIPITCNLVVTVMFKGQPKDAETGNMLTINPGQSQCITIENVPLSVRGNVQISNDVDVPTGGAFGVNVQVMALT